MPIRSTARDYGSVLLGSSTDSQLHKRIRTQTLLTTAIVMANVIGIAAAVVLATVGIPVPSVFRSELWWVNFLVVPIYIACALVVGVGWGTYSTVRDLRWAIRGDKATALDAKRARRAPWRLVAMQSTLWAGGTALLTPLYGIADPQLIPKILFIVGFSGTVVVAISSMLIEFILRPAEAELLAAGFTTGRRMRLRGRAIAAWLVGSGVPIIGILLVGLFTVIFGNMRKQDLVVSVWVIGGVALFTGLLLTVLSTTSVVGPVRSVQEGMRRVRAGDTDVDVLVYDGSELGDLQIGFNTMVRGLRERERIRDLFGRHVGQEVADAALRHDPELGGSEQVVATMFIDVIGSTTLAATRTPTETVSILNRFFGVIVDAVEEHQGLVNKFEGDAVLAIFGAPMHLPDPAGAALATARAIAEALPVEVPELDAGIGVGFGPAVAGNVGAIERFEYTVIGDPVNESARLSELAKRDPRRPLASEVAVSAASPAEAAHWETLDAEVLRGRTEPTVVCAARV
ncbi:adenylate cyclase [Gordonia araii NBRC 100433]|uniref:Adenylate cyclase n=1 Tax=Gordonia araii NBRC 100433 TaxID=1073574 RepID=G7H2Y8_9ACTN|nr:adenylate/guanylate cyclase domain-containing protein [Gordonia araii]NNG98303.1 adenylate/guanylate cyclase domain-containing protein [Gordonia araii NBRC 100433]GAB10213.1 adenylate cyclase [Gordonia araii NBRC 100433]